MPDPARRPATRDGARAEGRSGGTVTERIGQLRAELAALEAQQRDAVRVAIAEAFPREVFSAEQVWQQPALQAVCRDADITTVLQLGAFLRSWCGAGLARIDRTNRGIVWSVDADDLHQDPCRPIDDAV